MDSLEQLATQIIADATAYGKELIRQQGQELCDCFNYEISTISMEIASFDKNLYYDPEHATQFESHLLKHFSEVFHAVTEEDEEGVRVRLLMPEMELSEKVISCLSMAESNVLRRFSGRG